MTIYSMLVDMGIIERLKPGFPANSPEERRRRITECQRNRREAQKEAARNGLEWEPKKAGRPSKYSTPEEAIQAKRELYRASKARQLERMAEAIQKAILEKKEDEAQQSA
jgi:hypothetical protein